MKVVYGRDANATPIMVHFRQMEEGRMYCLAGRLHDFNNLYVRSGTLLICFDKRPNCKGMIAIDDNATDVAYYTPLPEGTFITLTQEA